ncbi:MAG: glycerol-3-phosphate 1-O-acyltransferase PlsY [Candidatus Pacebacteria bacterium]|nr:glycerol-3-phosphate 1-O-acyltransferase PlsY [Candidatus Paceibacterota bacterium]
MTEVTIPMQIVFIVLAYLLGSIPFGLILTRLAGLGDIRQIGSGNIGATNVLRTGNRGLAALTLILDAVKGAAAILLVRLIYPNADPTLAYAVAMAVIIGHIFPLWLGFKGGKGVATVLGIWLALCWPIGVIGALVWVLMLLAFRYSSLSALVAVIISVPLAWVFDLGFAGVYLALILTALIWWRHRDNIVRLLKGTESRVGKK